ncbi:hypothetical protein LPJ74_003512 [Coemansia sp. RSA 1843]|nr:hypothetical protein LPJ74_003512 [Coemansia sp. RSA 1843]
MGSTDVSNSAVAIDEPGLGARVPSLAPAVDITFSRPSAAIKGSKAGLRFRKLKERGQSLLSRSNSSSRKAGRQDRGLALENDSSTTTALPTHATDASPSPASAATAFLGARPNGDRTSPSSPNPNSSSNNNNSGRNNKFVSAFRVRSIRNAAASPTALTSSMPTINRRISDDDVANAALPPSSPPLRRNKLVRKPDNHWHKPRNSRGRGAQSMDFNHSPSMDFHHRPQSRRAAISNLLSCCSPVSLFRRGPTYGSMRNDARDQSPEEQQQGSSAAAAVQERLLPFDEGEEFEENEHDRFGARHFQAHTQAQNRLSVTDDTAVGPATPGDRSTDGSKLSAQDDDLPVVGRTREGSGDGDWFVSSSNRGLVDYEDFGSPNSGISGRNAAAVAAAAAAAAAASATAATGTTSQTSEFGAYNTAYSDFGTDADISSPGNSEYRTPPTSVGDFTNSSAGGIRRNNNDNNAQHQDKAELGQGAPSATPTNTLSKLYLGNESYENVSRKLTLETSSADPESIHEDDLDSDDDNGLRAELTSPPGNIATLSSERLVTHVNDQYLLPSIARNHSGRKCLVLDLDETLVHSSFREVEQPDYVVPVVLEGQEHNVYVVKRPGVDEFMRIMGQYYEVVVFTASLAMYADPVLDLLDKSKVVHHRLFRESCNLYNGNYVKDLSRLGRDVSHSIIIDNSPASYAFHPNNAIGISTWLNDPMDTELRDLIPFLIDLTRVDDVSAVLSLTHNHTSFVRD